MNIFCSKPSLISSKLQRMMWNMNETNCVDYYVSFFESLDPDLIMRSHMSMVNPQLYDQLVFPRYEVNESLTLMTC